MARAACFAVLLARLPGCPAGRLRPEPTLESMVVALTAEGRYGNFYDGEGLYAEGRTGTQRVGLCILDKVGVIVNVARWGENVKPLLEDLLPDMAACCTVSEDVPAPEDAPGGFCCFGHSCCEGKGTRAKPNDWCAQSRDHCGRCGGRPTWCDTGSMGPETAKEWCIGKLSLGYLVLRRLAVGEEAFRSHKANGTQNAIQGFGGDETVNSSGNSSVSDEGNRSANCQDAVTNESCSKWVVWAQKNGMYEHPEWYAPWGLSSKSGRSMLQANLWLRGEGGCPMPCDANISSRDLVGSYAGHLLAVARELLGEGEGLNDEAKHLLSLCTNFPKQPCQGQLEIPKSIHL